LDGDFDKTQESDEAVLGHELLHSYDYQEGNMKGEDYRRKDNRDPTEIRAVNFENRIRYSEGEKKLRTTYGGDPIENHKLENPAKPKD
jgi:hypothetical protein